MKNNKKKERKRMINMYINYEKLRYIRGKSSKQVFRDINILAEYYIGEYNDIRNVDTNVVPDIGELIKKQIIFEVYYAIYLSDLNPKTIAYFLKKYEKHEYIKNDSVSSDVDYAKMKSIYRKYRQYADSVAQYYYNDENIGKYKKIQQGRDCFEGHKISLLDYLYLKRLKNHANIEYLMDYLRNGRVSQSKKVSDEKFKKCFAVGIGELYGEISNTDYSKYGCKNSNYFYKSVEYYQFEKYCNIELCYMAAYAATQKKLKKVDELRCLRKYTLWAVGEYVCHIQNTAIWFGKNILPEYLKENININQMENIFLSVNFQIFVCKYRLMKQYFAEALKDVPLPLCGKYIQEQSSKNKNFLGIISLSDLMCEETEEFFCNYFGKGQHINHKNYDAIKLKYFRDLYETV